MKQISRNIKIVLFAVIIISGLSIGLGIALIKNPASPGLGPKLTTEECAAYLSEFPYTTMTQYPRSWFALTFHADVILSQDCLTQTIAGANAETFMQTSIFATQLGLADNVALVFVNSHYMSNLGSSFENNGTVVIAVLLDGYNAQVSVFGYQYFLADIAAQYFTIKYI